MQQPIHLLYLGGDWVNKIDDHVLCLVGENRLMGWAQLTEEEYAPVVVILLPPLKINMKRGIDGWLY